MFIRVSFNNLKDQYTYTYLYISKIVEHMSANIIKIKNVGREKDNDDGSIEN